MGRQTPGIIDVTEVIEVALAMIDEGGLKALTMRGLGRRLGVNPASLYHHFHNKDDVLEAVRESIFRKTKLPARIGNRSWEEQLLALGKAYRAGMIAHPNAIQLVAAANPMRTRVMGHPLYETVMKALLEVGFDEQQCAYLVIGIEVLTTGVVMQEMNLGKMLSYGTVDAERFPSLNRVSRRQSVNVPRSLNRILTDFLRGAAERMHTENKARPKQPRPAASQKSATPAK